METLWQDLRYALRVMAKSPGFVAVAVVALALGIGANTSLFSIVDAVLFRALPYKNPDQLVWATTFMPQQNQNLVFSDVYHAWDRQNRVFEQMGGYSNSADFTLTGSGTPERLHGSRVTATMLPLLGVSPRIGRNFSAEEDTPGGPNAVLLTDHTWKSDFGGDSNVIGKLITLDNDSYTVVGVLDPGFEFLDNTPIDLLVPFQLAESSIQNDHGRVTVRIQGMNAIGRLRPGIAVAAVQGDLAGINKQGFPTLPGPLAAMFAKGQVQAFTLHDHQVGSVRQDLLVLIGAVGFVLLIACANVANLQLARSAAREKEIAIRRALGSSRWRLVRLLLTESSVISLTGGIVGLGFALGVIQLIKHYGPTNIPRLLSAHLDARVLLFTLGVSLVTGFLFGLAPISAALRVSLNDTLKETGAPGGAGSGARNPQKVLMVLETALSLVLLIGAGLLVRTFISMTSIPAGFDPEGVLTARISLPINQYQTPEQQRAFFQLLVERLQALPGVASAGAMVALPLQNAQMMIAAQVQGQAPTDLSHNNVPTTAFNIVTPGAFKVMHIPLRAGRYLDERDGVNAPKTMVVNEALVRRDFPNEDPIGQIVTGLPDGSKTIVGVVADVKQRSLTAEILPQIYAPMDQMPTARANLVIRTSGNPMALVSAMRKLVLDLDSNVPLDAVQTMDDLIASQVASQRFNAVALSAFAGLAMLLAAVGIYGVMAYAVGQRTREFGIRMALGAERGDVLRMVLKQGLLLATIGIIAGLAASFGLTRLLSAKLYGVKATDPLTFALVTGVFVVVALAACWVPARRATRVDPVIALRYE
jgi:putative ABC transport system permease protein